MSCDMRKLFLSLCAMTIHSHTTYSPPHIYPTARARDTSTCYCYCYEEGCALSYYMIPILHVMATFRPFLWPWYQLQHRQRIIINGKDKGKEETRRNTK